MVDERRTPPAGRRSRENRYAFGRLAIYFDQHWDSLADELLHDRGHVRSRTKFAPPDRHGNRNHVVVNKISCEAAANTLLVIAEEPKFKKSIAWRLLLNVSGDLHGEYQGWSFDYKERVGAYKVRSYDYTGTRIILESGILAKDDVVDLPWSTLVKNEAELYMLERRRPDFDEGEPYLLSARTIELVSRFASDEEFANCWMPRFARRDDKGRFYDEVKTLPLFVDVLSADKCANKLDVLKALVDMQEFEVIEKLAAKPGWITKRRIVALIDYVEESWNNANESARMETVTRLFMLMPR